ncbi:glycoside hydrolase family 32 protein [Metabacillus halosaccharovorans]|uniref:glycoside hydrolase family 32 protein n=1 Tax=Metabacillus halosaccharovorans TaxID=930124 RepID=UPI001C1F7F24|nr:glycoside hydrolase family 32 protein [Metabacillus halosaccharovorans]MBU7595572.1 glycoside hydrolase family 32 protein [Metabacillus halosaccharovorans]
MTQKLTEKYRPQFHFSPEEKWMNDPNGMVYFEGEYHLFYQYHPSDTIWGPMHWGHAVSKDLIHWEHLPIALHPDEHGTIFSGSAVVDWNNTTGFFDDEPGLVAIFTHHDTYPETDSVRQRQSIAYSHDKGRTWIKYEGNPVLSDPSMTDYRDPKVFWHQPKSKWIMILATGQCVTLYTSPNLIDWEFASQFGDHDGSHAGFWECPDLFPLQVDQDPSNQKWVMIVSIGDTGEFSEGSRTQYFIGDFDGITFKNDNDAKKVLWLDYGRDNYAGVSWSDIPESDGRRIYLGWMSNWRYANLVPTTDWRGAMTLPRELNLVSTTNGIRLIQKPVTEVNSLRENGFHHDEEVIVNTHPLSITLDDALQEINIEIENIDSSVIDCVIKHSNKEETLIRYDTEKEELTVDRTNSGEHSFSSSFQAIQHAPLSMVHNRIKLQVFLDTSSIEVFANDGAAAVTSLIFPTEGSKKLELSSQRGSVKIHSLQLTKLISIWSE